MDKDDAAAYSCGCCCLVSILIIVGTLVIPVYILPFISSLFEPQVSDDLINAFTIVADGQGVPEATEYIQEPGLHPVILLNLEGQRHTWTNKIPVDWRSDNVSSMQLVVLVSDQLKEVIEICHYSGPDITRYRYYVSIYLRAARSGNLITNTTLFGTMPRECRQVEDYDTTELHGDQVAFTNLSVWLGPYVIAE
jgi:hypothetical protein